jgi:4'-phosphopantetheinyl transferase
VSHSDVIAEPTPGPGAIPAPGTLPAPIGLQVQIWWARVEVGELDEDLRACLAADLNPETIARLDRFHRAHDRDRGLAAHALLRRVLAGVAGGRPSELSLRTRCAACGETDHGKPYLDVGAATAPVEVNLSHSGQVVCLALTAPGVPVGVDVEQRREVDWPALRRSVFADAEWTATAGAADPDRHRMDAWARKESSVKASGHGLSLPLRRVLVTDAVWGGWTASLPAETGSTAGWDLPIDFEVAAAVAIHDPDLLGMPEAPVVHQVGLRSA